MTYEQFDTLTAGDAFTFDGFKCAVVSAPKQVRGASCPTIEFAGHPDTRFLYRDSVGRRDAVVAEG